VKQGNKRNEGGDGGKRRSPSQGLGVVVAQCLVGDQ